MTTVTRPSRLQAGSAAPEAVPQVVMWPVARIRPRPTNPRAQLRGVDELAATIDRHGLLEPLVVEHVPPGAGGGWVTLVAGHRRLAALQRLGWREAPIIPRWVGSATHALLLALVENMQRDELDPVDEAHAYQQLKQAGMTSRAIARALGVPEARVSARLQLLALDETARQRVSAGDLPVTHAVDAVRTARRQTAAGRDPKRAPAAPAHLGLAHRLAATARAMCDARQHPSRGRLGRTACGACWEDAIRTDERHHHFDMAAEAGDPDTP